jgi:conjugal transfer ATP-binding protein TraC
LKEIPPYDENMPINRQIIAPNTKIIVKDTHIEVDNKTWISLAPQKLSKYASIFDFGEKLGDYTSVNPETSQFPDNFIVTMTTCRLPKKQLSIVENNHKVIATQKWDRRIFRAFAKAQDESIEILDRIDSKEPLFAMDLNVLVSGNDFEEAKKNVEVVKTFWKEGGNTKGINLEETIGIHHLNFLASLPMGANEEYIFEVTKKYRSMFLKNVAQYAPLEADFKGQGDNFMLITRRSQLATYDLFKSDKSFNAYVVATSGAGKSVFLQTIALNSYARGDRIFVLDYDNSFYGICQALDAQYVALNPNKPISFNPFSELNSLEELKEDLAYLSDFIYMLGASKSQAKSLEVEKLIKTRIQEVLIELYLEHGNKLEITHIRNKLRQEKDQRFKDFATQLGAFCREGIYGRFFEGKNEFNIKKDFIAVEFKEMSEHPDIRDPIIMMLIYHLNQMMYSGKNREGKLQIILDEAHRFLGKNPRMDDFIDQAYRRARKYNASIMLATQGFDDIYDPKSGGLSAAGKVIIANSPWKFFLTQTETSLNMLFQSGVFNFDEMDKKTLRSIHTNKGEYSEIFVITPNELKVPNRLIMNRFFYYITTTDPTDKAKIKKYTDLGFSYIEAIKKVMEEEEKEEK